MEAKTGRRMQISASFCMASRGPRRRGRPPAGAAPATTTGWPDWRLPGASTTWSPTATPESTSVHSGGAASGGDRLLDGLAALHRDHLLQAGEGDDRAAGHGGRAPRTARSRSTARANDARAQRPVVGHVRLHEEHAVALADGGAEARDAARCTRATPSTEMRTACPARTLPASRSGTSARKRRGSMRTRSTTGAPAARNSPDAGAPLLDHARERRVHAGVAELLPGQRGLRPPLRRRWRGGSGSLRARPGTGSPPPCRRPRRRRSSAWAMSPSSTRVAARSWAEPRLVQHRARLTDGARLRGVDAGRVALRRQADAGAGLGQRGVRLLGPELVVDGLDAGEELALAHAGCRGRRRGPARGPATLVAIVARSYDGERAVHGDALADGARDDGGDTDCPRLAGGTSAGGLRMNPRRTGALGRPSPGNRSCRTRGRRTQRRPRSTRATSEGARRWGRAGNRSGGRRDDSRR